MLPFVLVLQFYTWAVERLLMMKPYLRLGSELQQKLTRLQGLQSRSELLAQQVAEPQQRIKVLIQVTLVKA